MVTEQMHCGDSSHGVDDVNTGANVSVYSAHTNEAYIGSTVSIPGAYRSTQQITTSYDPGNGKVGSEANKDPLQSMQHTHIPKVTVIANITTASAPNKTRTRENWGNDIEFLLSCISLSVGLGNVWRFPFTALENGGGAFVIPYLVVLFLVGKPIYYMEMLLGQFSSRGSVKVFDFSPIMRGVGYGQVIATGVVTTYYATLMAMTLRYFIDSFHSILPWSYCRDEWSDCFDSTLKTIDSETMTAAPGVKTSSAEYYFVHVILREKTTIDDGIGYPSWSLSITLAVAWFVIALIMIKGVKSSGKASYFLAIFPYVILFILLLRSLTLPGAFDGVWYFLKPQWDKLLDPKVWYAAVTQVFFSLAICFGNIIMYASYNRFGHNIKRDCTVVTTLDTFTSLLSGVVIFGILGNLAYESNTTDIRSVVKGGAGLAFISYPDAIAKFKIVPQLFSVLFFFMLFVLGIGSNVGMASCIATVIRDQFTKVKHWLIVVCIAVVGYLLGLLYITPGGQYLLTLMDFYGASFVALVLAIFELLAVGWIYGVKRLCKDVQFMLGIKTSVYYRLCWAIVTPTLMAIILIYTLMSYEPLKYNGYTFHDGLYGFGWCLSAFVIGQLIIWAAHAVYKTRGDTLRQRFSNAFQPLPSWGPLDSVTLAEYKRHGYDLQAEAMFRKNGVWQRIYDNIFG